MLPHQLIGNAQKQQSIKVIIPITIQPSNHPNNHPTIPITIPITIPAFVEAIVTTDKPPTHSIAAAAPWLQVFSRGDREESGGSVGGA